MNGQSGCGRRGFALAELAAVLVVVLLTLALAIPMARRARLAGWGVVDAENLHRFAAATGSYAADNSDKYWTFSWHRAWSPGEKLPSQSPDLQNANDTDMRAAVAQVADFMRYRGGGRPDFPYIYHWFPYVSYSHIPLYDYLDQQVPALWGVSPSDRWRLEWAKDPQQFDQGEFLPNQPKPGSDNKRWPYSSSYQLPPAFYDLANAGRRVSQADTENNWFVPQNSELRGTRLSRTWFPSQKVHLYGAQARSLGDELNGYLDAPSFCLPSSRVPILLCDGHSELMRTSDANPGWQPNAPESPDPTYIPLGSNGSYPGVYRWTRGGIYGRDFGGPEVDVECEDCE